MDAGPIDDDDADVVVGAPGTTIMPGRSPSCSAARSSGCPVSVAPRDRVEISIAYATDWAVQNLGVFTDDVTLPDGSSTSFEADLGGWTAGQPDSSGTNANNWIRTDASGFPVGATISTPDSLLFGFGFEGISTQESRNAVMRRTLRHLLD